MKTSKNKIQILVLTFLLLFAPYALMSQPYQEQNTQQVYKSINVGYSFGSFTNEINYGKQHDTGGFWGPWFETYSSNEFKESFNVVSLAYSITKIRENYQMVYGINAYFGSINEEVISTNKTSRKTIASLSPYFQIDQKWIGFGFGLYIGSNYYAFPKSNQEKTGTPQAGLGNSVFYPRFHFRLGPERFFAFEFNFADNFPCALPSITYSTAIGSGFGFRNGLYFKYGTIYGSQTNIERSNFFSANIPIKNKVVIVPFIGTGSFKNIFMCGIQYRFGHAEIPFVPKEN